MRKPPAKKKMAKGKATKPIAKVKVKPKLPALGGGLGGAFGGTGAQGGMY